MTESQSTLTKFMAKPETASVAESNAQAAPAEAPSIVTVFEEMAARFPNKAALYFGQEAISYEELNWRANRLARTLIDLAQPKESLIGICADRSVEMIAGMLGILKAGAAYVPLDTTYPQERLDFMIADTNTALILTQRRFAGLLEKS